MDLGIKGKKALVCGASSGIGLAIARELAKEGVQLLLCSRSEGKLEEAKAEIAKFTSDPILTKAADLSESAQRLDLLESVKADFDCPDILIHNTGGPSPTTTTETTLEDWQNGFDRLFMSVAHLTEAFLPKMKERKWGRIITVTSLTVLEPVKTLAVSNAIRSSTTSMLKALSDEVAPFNITVNCIAPGAIRTERLEQLKQARMERLNQTEEEYDKNYLASIPAGRLGDPEEFGAVAAFLASQRASYVTGSTICVDGGKRRSTY